MNRRLKQTNEIYEISFQLNITQAHIFVRFPCTFFLALRNNGNKLIVKTQRDNISSQNGRAQFNQTLCFKTYILYDRQTQKFCHKETTLGLYLISQRKPDQQKLVGRVKIDLGFIANQNIFQETRQHKLQFSSIKDAKITFNMKILSKQKTELTINQLDMDSFSHLDISDRDGETNTITNNKKMIQNSIISQKSSQKQNHSNMMSNSNKYQEIQSQINQIRTEKQKLEQQNKKLLKKLEKNTDTLHNYQQKQSSDYIAEIALLKQNLKQVQIQKNDIVQQLLAQIQQQTKSKIQYQNKLSEINMDSYKEDQRVKQMMNTIEKLQRNLQQNQNLRLELQTQNLEMKYQLSELKASNQYYLNVLQQKQQIIQNNRIPNSNTTNNKQIEQLRNTITTLQQQNIQLTKQLQCADSGTNRMQQVSEAYTGLHTQYQKLTQKYNKITAQKQRLQQQKKQLQDKILKPTQSQLNQNLQQKMYIIQAQMQRLREEIATHQQNKQQSQIYTKNIQEQMQNVTEQLNKTQKDLRIQREKINSIIIQRNSLQEQIASINQKYGKLQQQCLNQKQVNAQYVENLQAKIKNLQNKVSQQYAQLNRKKDNSSTQQKIQKQLKTANQQIKKLQTDIKTLQGQLKNNHRHKQDSIDFINQLKDQISELNKLRTEYINKQMKLNNQMKSNKNKYEKVSADLKIRDANISEKNMIIEHLNRQIQSQIKKAHLLEDRISKFAEKQLQMRQNIFVMEEESKKIYDIVVEQQNVLETQDAQLNQKDDEIGVLKMQNSQLLERALKLQQQLNKTKQQIYQLKMHYISKQSNQQQIIDTPITQTQKLHKLQQTANQRIKQLQQTLDDKNQDLIQKANQFNRNLNLLEQQKKQLQQKIIQLNKQKGQQKKQKEQLTQKLRKMEFVLQEEKLKVQSMSDQLVGCRAQHVRQMEMKNDQYLFLEKKNKSLEDLMNNIDKKMRQQSKQLQEYIARLGELQMTKTQENKDCLNTIDIIKQRKLTQQNQSLKKNISELQQANQKLNNKLSSAISEAKESGQTNKQRKLDVSHVSLVSTISSTSKQLKSLITERSKLTKSEQAIQILVNNNKMLEDNLGKIMQQRGMIQQNARKLSLQFQKIKANLLKGRANTNEKRQLLHSLRPCEIKVKDLINLAENLQEFVNIMDEPIDE